MGTQAETPSKFPIFLQASASRFFDLVTPRFCAGCDQRLQANQRVTCDSCRETLMKVSNDYCMRCGAHQGPYVGAISSCIECADLDQSWPYHEVASLGAHSGPLREAVVSLKFRGRHQAAKLLGNAMAETISRRQWPINAIVPIPLSKKRRFDRGYDQAALLAKAVASALDVPYVSGVLKRKKHTDPQTTLSAPARKRNLQSAFKLGPKKELIAGKHLLIVDDVFTTGATLASAAKPLLKAKAEKLYAIVASRSSH